MDKEENPAEAVLFSPESLQRLQESVNNPGLTQRRKTKKPEGYSRKARSLGTLCEEYISQFCPMDGSIVDVETAGIHLGVERRRVYDIINILEGLRLTKKEFKNKYVWHGVSVINKVLEDLHTEAVEELESGLQPNLNDRKEKSMTRLVERFVQMFLLGQHGVISLEDSAAALMGGLEDPNGVKTKVRRLYDIASIMVALHFIEKVIHGDRSKPGFRWLGGEAAKKQILSLQALKTGVMPNVPIIPIAGGIPHDVKRLETSEAEEEQYERGRSSKKARKQKDDRCTKVMRQSEEQNIEQQQQQRPPEDLTTRTAKAAEAIVEASKDGSLQSAHPLAKFVELDRKSGPPIIRPVLSGIDATASTRREEMVEGYHSTNVWNHWPAAQLINSALASWPHGYAWPSAADISTSIGGSNNPGGLHLPPSQIREQTAIVHPIMHLPIYNQMPGQFGDAARTTLETSTATMAAVAALHQSQQLHQQLNPVHQTEGWQPWTQSQWPGAVVVPHQGIGNAPFYQQQEQQQWPTTTDRPAGA